MKLFTAAQIREWDAHTLQVHHLTSLQLMEQAAGACTEWLISQYPATTPFLVLCGTGNNGGDGLAITRLLHQAGFGVKALLIKYREQLSTDCAINLGKLEETAPGMVQVLPAGSLLSAVPEGIILLDALLGTGTNRPAEGWLAQFIESVNQLGNNKIAIDMPSGLPADGLPAENAIILEANATLTFQQYKTSLLHPETGRFAGPVTILDIGLDASFRRDAYTTAFTTGPEEATALYNPRKEFSHKGTYGTAIIAGGSYGMIGAVGLAAKAASRGGAGKVGIMAPDCGYAILQSLCPEAMFHPCGGKHIDALNSWKRATAIGIGPGMGTASATATALHDLLVSCDKPLVLDADAINLLALHKNWLTLLKPGTILTPHPKEFGRLFGETNNSFSRVECACREAIRYRIILVLKDRYTCVILPDGSCHYNLSGNAALATGGSGDVLCGLITGLLASGYVPENAARLGVYLHGKAGELVSRRLGMESVIAGDVAESIGKAFLSITNKN